MSNYVKHIRVTGLYGRFELQQEFYPGVNVLYGQNGSGKSTLLHILANALNGDYGQFAYLPFESIQIELNDGVLIVLTQDKKLPSSYPFNVLVNGKPISQFEYLPQIQVEIVQAGMRPESLDDIEPLLLTAYFPAFRNMIDAFHVTAAGWPPHPSKNDSVYFARRLFGKFVPELSYLSAFETLTSKYNRQGKELAPYLMAVNSFLCGKKIVYKSSKLKLQFADDNHDEGLTALSSGERHLITMLYTASLQSEYNVILIDEPEMCLHIDWQEQLLREMMAQKAGRQLIVCTHSPMIGVEYEDRMMEVSLTTTKKRNICEKKVPA